MRKKISLNRNWQFKESFEVNDPHSANISEFIDVDLPHTHKELPYNSFDEEMYQFISCYRKTFKLDNVKSTERVLLHFEGSMTYTVVYLNGHFLGEHKGGYTPFVLDLTEYLEENNELIVKVDGREIEDIPPFGFVVDFLTYAGIYRDVYLEIVHELYVEKCHTRTEMVLETNKRAISEVYIKNIKKEMQTFTVKTTLKDLHGHVISRIEGNVINSDELIHCTQELNELNDIQLWSTENPVLYEINIEISNGNGQLLDFYKHRLGFRTAEFKVSGFYLNGEKTVIRGLNRHQSYPYVGNAMPKRAQIDDADILKYDLGVNLVRTSHYPQSKDFLDRCDEIGLLVFEEIPGWQHIGNEKWQSVARKNIEAMINRDYNHPSIIIWGVRINESKDHHEFYTSTNEIARRLDDTRPTGGVRVIKESEFLEDVFTFNDFVQGDPNDRDDRILIPQHEATGLNELVPYLVTEYNGHMFPTKRFDQIQRQEEHVKRHLNVLNMTELMQHTCGSIGWCAFDYNTHYQFGSGDRICYHGVMDMFRLPKFASYAYTSQINPSKKIVMEPVLIYAMGEKNYGGITPLTILTNVDSIEYRIDDKLFGRYYKDKSKFPGLKHPPIIIEGVSDVWGSGFHDIEFIGYIKGKQVIRKLYVKNPVVSQLELKSDHKCLSSLEADVTRVVVSALDQVGNVSHYSDLVVELDIKGPGEIIGPKTFALISGQRAFWVKTSYMPGIIEITAKIHGRKISDRCIIEVEQIKIN
ncbi:MULTISPECIES: glycoside hydrolase family 2 TIM barrel-domain containing protein [unclassified Fusibacter]|uniref:glycoside hydrolase family 2 protein n=1 Tax=unclassified Fusibacter TaxID=2624464 RepID=UPI0010137F35|nr:MULTISPECIES: glycoside hydrolase family 2 TIM barrel-domain containing protein [unclassified Fusibacter]MCK8061628.1 glycoside hydrolase family 2 protein [Fusibacter sp. A2]NPE23811.1 glycoside hydrolase family 2 protein [Fusibacter sp. A1]RXV58649.1 glycoside hydrolase family 2 protein [Fusibacter sp. A1]